MTTVTSRQPVGSQGLEQAHKSPPSPILSQRTGQVITAPRDGLVNPPVSAASGAVADTLHLTHEEQEQVAAYMGRVWQGATGTSAVPPLENIISLLAIALRKSREVIAAR